MPSDTFAAGIEASAQAVIDHARACNQAGKEARFSDIVPVIRRLTPTDTDTAIPAGWKLVPIEPDRAMLYAYLDCPYEGPEDKWAAMLAASPKPDTDTEV